MPSTCSFNLNKPNRTYFSGETITGTIVLNTTSDKNVRDVSIIFRGEGKVKWTETDTTSNNTTTATYYTSHEVYVNNITYVLGEGTLAAGTHTYSFNIALPWDCPTSFEGKYGHIRYEISLKINRFFRFDNVYKKPLTVIKTIDLNLDPLFKRPLIVETFNQLCYWCCSSGKIVYTLKIPFRAYAPGQTVKYFLHIENQSMSDTNSYDIEFTRKTTFTSKSPSKKQRHKKDVLVAISYADKCLRLTNRLIEGKFKIPATAPTTSRESIICVVYKLKLTVRLTGCHSSSELEMPIIIGTIPLRESLQAAVHDPPQLTVAPTAPQLPDPCNQNSGNDLPPSYSDIQPPSFEECTRSSSPFLDTDVDEKNRIVGFKPLYPMYNLSYVRK